MDHQVEHHLETRSWTTKTSTPKPWHEKSSGNCVVLLVVPLVCPIQKFQKTVVPLVSREPCAHPKIPKTVVPLVSCEPCAPSKIPNNVVPLVSNSTIVVSVRHQKVQKTSSCALQKVKKKQLVCLPKSSVNKNKKYYSLTVKRKKQTKIEHVRGTNKGEEQRNHCFPYCEPPKEKQVRPGTFTPNTLSTPKVLKRNHHPWKTSNQCFEKNIRSSACRMFI